MREDDCCATSCLCVRGSCFGGDRKEVGKKNKLAETVEQERRYRLRMQLSLLFSRALICNSLSLSLSQILELAFSSAFFLPLKCIPVTKVQGVERDGQRQREREREKDLTMLLAMVLSARD